MYIDVSDLRPYGQSFIMECMTFVIDDMRGRQVETGFWGDDMSRIQMGDADPMTTGQFCVYATETITKKVVPHLSPDAARPWADDVQELRKYTDGLGIVRSTGKYSHVEGMGLMKKLESAGEQDRDELDDAIARFTAPVGSISLIHLSPATRA